MEAECPYPEVSAHVDRRVGLSDVVRYHEKNVSQATGIPQSLAILADLREVHRTVPPPGRLKGGRISIPVRVRLAPNGSLLEDRSYFWPHWTSDLFCFSLREQGRLSTLVYSAGL